MGQKVNPNGFRLNFKKTFITWYEIQQKYSCLLNKNYKILIFFEKKKNEFAINKIKINQNIENKIININIHTPYPQLIKASIYKQLQIKVKEKLFIKLFKIHNPIKKINFLSEIIADQIKERITFQRIIQIILQKLEKITFKGIKIQIAGRLNGIEKAKTEWFKKGQIPLNTISAQIEYVQKTVLTKFGTIGIKIWLFKN